MLNMLRVARGAILPGRVRNSTRAFITGGVLLGALLAAACAATPDDASPRERALALMARYNVVQTAALAAVQSTLLADLPNVKNAIKATSQAATAAVLAIDAAARPCIRLPDGTIGTRPDSPTPCNPDMVTMLLPAASAALAQLSASLSRYGFLKES